MAVTHRELAALNELSEQGLVELHRNGDHEAFANIVRRYQPGLLAHARRRLGSQQAAEDAVQETLLRAYRALPRFNGEYRLGNWLHRILRNVCVDEGNRRRRHLALVERITSTEPACAHEAVSADARLLGSGRSGDVVRALDELPESYRTAFVLRAVDELPYDEVALELGISEENARARVSRARNVLRRTTARFGAFVSVLGVTLRRGNRGGGSGAGVGNAVNQASSAASSSPGITTNPALIQLTTAVHDYAPTASAAGRAIAVLASAAAVLVPAALSQTGGSSSPSDDDAAAVEQARTSATDSSAPEVLAIDLPAGDATSTSVSVTSTSVAPSTSLAPLRTATVTFNQLTLRPDGDAWTVTGTIAVETVDSMVIGTLEPYSQLALGPSNDWGGRSFQLTGYATLADGRALTVRMSGTAIGDPPSSAPTTTSSTSTSTTSTTLPPSGVTTTTVVGDRPDDAPPITADTIPDEIVSAQRPARYDAPPAGHFDLSGTVQVDGADGVGLFTAGSITGALELQDDGGTLSVSLTETR